MRFLVFGLLCVASPGPAGATGPEQFDYMTNCQGCHLADGSGSPARGVPGIAGELGRFLRVEGGREFLVQVPGSAQSDLDDVRLAAVINWMLATFSSAELPPDFTPYTVDEVARLRADPLVDVKAVRAKLMVRIQRLEARSR